jgi:hypothetical protein
LRPKERIQKDGKDKKWKGIISGYRAEYVAVRQRRTAATIMMMMMMMMMMVIMMMMI